MVIQIPNPLLLPQSYGMGEVAGMSFGSNYVIMMQIGYRYYAPRIIEEMEKDNLDHPMGTVWWNKWQKFMLTYSDQSIKNTMDRTLEMPEQALKAIWDKIFNILPSGDITETGGGDGSEITQVRLNRNQDIQSDRDRIANDLRIAEQKILEFTHGVLTAETLADAKRRAEALAKAKAKQDIINANLQSVKSPVPGGQTKFTITNPSIATGTATGIFRTSNVVRTPTKPRAPRSIVIQIRKFEEEIKASIKWRDMFKSSARYQSSINNAKKRETKIRGQIIALQRKYQF